MLRDFVVPKLFKAKWYVICPVIDMANHTGLSILPIMRIVSSRPHLPPPGLLAEGKEVRISYGARSNDALLQNYGFVERTNPHDVYVMPSLGEWDIQELEKAWSDW